MSILHTFRSTLCEPCLEIFKNISEYPRWPSEHVEPYDASTVSWPSLLRTRPSRQPADSPDLMVKFHNIQALLCSAADGCHLCTLIMTELSPKTVNDLLEQLIKRPEIAWHQLNILVWRSNTQLIVRLQESTLREGMRTEAIFLHLAYAVPGPESNSQPRPQLTQSFHLMFKQTPYLKHQVLQQHLLRRSTRSISGCGNVAIFIPRACLPVPNNNSSLQRG
jgi:hypothetical protein